MVIRPVFLKISLLVFALIGASFFFWSWHQNLSGTYIHQTDNTVRMIRLVEDKNGKLSGQFESVVLDNSGKITNGSASVDGSTDGENLSLKLSFPSLLPVPITVSGTHDWDSLTLTFGVSGKPSQTEVYPASDLAAFQSASDELTKKSQEILAEKATAEIRARAEAEREKFEGDVAKLITEMQSLDGKLDNAIKKFPDIEHKYSAITTKVQAYYDKAQQVSYSRNSYAIGQIEYAMNQGRYATDQLHFQVQSLDADFNAKTGPIVQAADSYKKSCQNISIKQPDICLKLVDVGRPFGEKVITMSEGLKHLEEVYKDQYSKQSDLVMAVQHL